jgi:hypothetical protein
MLCLYEKLEADAITMSPQVFLNPSNLKEHGDPDLDLGEKEFTPDKAQDGQELIGEQVKAPGADILDPPLDDPLPFPGKSQVGKLLDPQLADQRIPWVLTPLQVPHQPARVRGFSPNVYSPNGVVLRR